MVKYTLEQLMNADYKKIPLEQQLEMQKEMDEYMAAQELKNQLLVAGLLEIKRQEEQLAQTKYIVGLLGQVLNEDSKNNIITEVDE